MSSEKNKKGTISEYKAAVEFMKKGFYVSKAMDSQCPFDLVITNKKGECSLIDVKTISRRKNKSHWCKAGSKINRSPSKLQKQMNINIYDQESDS